MDGEDAGLPVNGQLARAGELRAGNITAAADLLAQTLEDPAVRRLASASYEWGVVFHGTEV